MSINGNDFNVYNMPEMLGRVVRMQDPNDPTKWIRDESWYDSVRQSFYYLFKFFQENELVQRTLVKAPHDVDGIVLRFSDLTQEGKAFVNSHADERWLAALDRPASEKLPSDVSYLKKQLDKLRSKLRIPPDAGH